MARILLEFRDVDGPGVEVTSWVEPPMAPGMILTDAQKVLVRFIHFLQINGLQMMEAVEPTEVPETWPNGRSLDEVIREAIGHDRPTDS